VTGAWTIATGERHAAARRLHRVHHCAVAIRAPVAAQEFPSRPLTLVVPFAAGGSTGLIARMMLPRMSEVLGQQTIPPSATSSRGGVQPSPGRPHRNARGGGWP